VANPSTASRPERFRSRMISAMRPAISRAMSSYSSAMTVGIRSGPSDGVGLPVDFTGACLQEPAKCSKGLFRGRWAATVATVMRTQTTSTDRCRVFRLLHESGCFVIPNPWDVGSARLLAQLGFRALATTSAGFAWTLGRPDNGVTLGDALDHLRAVSHAVSVPVNADFEGGFATEPAEVAANVAAATTTGIAGLSIEDSTGEASNPLYELPLAVERIRAARRAIDDSGTGVLLTGRSEGFIVGRPDLAETLRRLTAYAEAGADCLYAPGIRSTSDIQAVVSAVAPKPVNVLVGSDFATVSMLAELGVRRISVGGALARAAWTGFLQAAREIAEQGTFTHLARALPFAEIERAFTSE
jgi:2-methylisocitrate lyase-like PEP mutase family enzyme